MLAILGYNGCRAHSVCALENSSLLYFSIILDVHSYAPGGTHSYLPLKYYYITSPVAIHFFAVIR